MKEGKVSVKYAINGFRCIPGIVHTEATISSLWVFGKFLATRLSFVSIGKRTWPVRHDSHYFQTLLCLPYGYPCFE